MALVYPGGAFVVFDASVVLRRRRMQVAGQAIASVRAGRVDANRIGTATVAFRAALRFAFVDICEEKKNKKIRSTMSTISVGHAIKMLRHAPTNRANCIPLEINIYVGRC